MRIHPTNKSAVTSPYGWRVHPISKKRVFHAGTDFRAKQGTPLYATFAGTVYRSHTANGGNRVELRSRSGGTRVWYLHLSRFAVPHKTKVKPGDIIGYAGATGNVTAAHLHFEVYVSGVRRDPEVWLRNAVAVNHNHNTNHNQDWMDTMFKDKNEFRRTVQLAVRAEIARTFQEEKDQAGTPGGLNRQDWRKLIAGMLAKFGSTAK